MSKQASCTREHCAPVAVRQHGTAHPLPAHQPRRRLCHRADAGLAFIQLHGSPGLFTDQPLAAAMLLWAFAASFGMGAIGTGLALRAYE